MGVRKGAYERSHSRTSGVLIINEDQTTTVKSRDRLKVCHCSGHPTYLPAIDEGGHHLFACKRCNGRMLVHVVREMRDVLVDARRAGLDPWVTVGGILTSTVEDSSHKAAIVAALMLAVMELSGDEDATTDDLNACSNVVKFLKSRDRWY